MSVIVLSPGQGQVPADLPELLAAADQDLLQAYVGRFGEEAVAQPLATIATTQASLVATSVTRGRRVLALLERHSDQYGPVVGFAGHSLGELTALALAGALRGGESVEVAADRGWAFEYARDEAWDDLAMLALSGPTIRDHLDALLKKHPTVLLGNDNAIDQVVVSGPNGDLADLTAEARELGLRAVRLETTGPGHTKYMAGATPAFRGALERRTFYKPAASVWSGSTAQPMTSPAEQLSVAISTQLRWRETLQGMGELGPTHVVDTGPGKAMGRLARKTLPDLPILTLEDLEAAT